MATTSHFASASLSMPVSVRVEVFDSRTSASKKNGTPLAKFRMRTPASTTFGCLGQAVAERYMKESAGTITIAPQIVCVLDKEDCTFDLDDSIDIVVPNEAIRFVLDRGSRSTQQSVSSSGITQAQVNGNGANYVNGHGSTYSGRASVSTSRQPALLQQRLATAPVAAQVPVPASPTTRQPMKLANGVNGHHNSTPQSTGLPNRKRDPYEINSEDDANDPPSRHSLSRGPQPSLSAAPRSSRPSATKPSLGKANGTHLMNGDGAMIAATTPSAQCEEFAPHAAVTPQRPANPHDKAESRERSIKQVEAGAEVVSVYGTDSKGAPSPTEQHFLPNQVQLPQSSRRSVVPPGADVVSVADSGSHDDSDSDEIPSPPRLPTQRSLGKRSYHTVNEHINFEDKQTNSSRNADPTPILLKNSRGVFPVYRKGEAPSSEFGGPMSEELGNAQPLLSRSGGPHTVPRKLPVAATANGISQGPRSDPISWENFEDEFAGFDELSDFEIAPRARAATSQPNHRTQTPSRSSLKAAREPGSARNPFSSIPPRSSPLESKQARLPYARDHGRALARPAPRSTQPLPLPQRGSNNRASREPSVIELPETPTSSFPKQPRAVSAAGAVVQKSSQSRGIGGNDIRQWIASRRSSNPEPAKSSPVPTGAAVRPLKPAEAIRKVKSMTEMKMKPKSKAVDTEVPEVFYVEDDVRQDVYNSATSSIEIADDETVSKQKPPTSAQRPTFSRASSCVSSQAGYAESKRGRIPSSPFYPIDAIASQDQQPPENSARQQRFNRGYSKRVRAIFSDASESSDADANAEPKEITKPKTRAPSSAINSANAIRSAAAESSMESAKTDDSPSTVATGSKIILSATRTSHPKWKPWWHPWGWINRYETVFLVGGAIGNGPYEGYDLMNGKAGVYIEGCEAPSEDLLAAEDLTCKKDETRLMQRRERRRTRRLAGDFQWHEDDGFDSSEELAREFGEHDDICKGLSIAHDIEIPNTMQTDSEEDEESSSESEESDEDIDMKNAIGPTTLKVAAVEEDEDSSGSEDSDADIVLENATSVSAPITRLIEDGSDLHLGVSDDKEEKSVHKLPSAHGSPLKQPELNDKVAEKHVRMERTRQYALTGEVSSQSQSQDEMSATSHDAAEIKSLARASEATSAHSTTTSVLIARQLGVSSPPSNQELAIIMSSSPTKQVETSRMDQEQGCESEAEDDSGSNIASIPARLPSPHVDTQSSESQVEIHETPAKTRPEAAMTIEKPRNLIDIDEKVELPSRSNVLDLNNDKSPSPEVEDITEAVRSAKKAKKQKDKKEKKYKKLTKTSTPKPDTELIIELPPMSQEQRSSYSETRPTASTPPPPQLRSFENLNAVGTSDVSLRKRASTPVIISDDDDDAVEYVLRESPKWLKSNLQINSPVMTLPRLTGDSDVERGSGPMSPIVARSQRKRRVTFGDDLATVGDEDAESGEPQSSTKSPFVKNHHQPVLRSPEIHPVDSTPSKRKTATPRKGAQKSPGKLKQEPDANNVEAEELHIEPLPSKSKPPKARRVPVVSFAVSDSEEDNTILSLDGLPNVVEDVKPRRTKTPAKEWKPALSQRAITPVPPPSIPVNLGAVPGPGQYLSASQPVPTKAQVWSRPRIITPTPLPVIPPTSDSELYKMRPQVIEIDGTEPSDSKGDSDVVMIPRPSAVSPLPPVGPPQVPTSALNVKLELQAAPQNEPTPSPEPALPVIFPRDDIDVEPSSEQEVHSPPAEDTKVREQQPKKKLSNRARKKAEKAKEKKDKRKRRLSSKGNTASAAALMASPRSHAIITSIDKASGGRRSSGNFQLPAPVGTTAQVRKRQKKNKRRERLRALPGAETVESPVQHEFAPIAGRKRKDRRESTDQQQQLDIRHDTNNDTALEGSLLAEAVKRAKKRKLGGPADNIIKREKKVDGSGGIGGGIVDEAGFLQSSSSQGNIPSSHPSLISPPTTSRPSSAGSRGSR